MRKCCIPYIPYRSLLLVPSYLMMIGHGRGFRVLFYIAVSNLFLAEIMNQLPTMFVKTHIATVNPYLLAIVFLFS